MFREESLITLYESVAEFFPVKDEKAIPVLTLSSTFENDEHIDEI